MKQPAKRGRQCVENKDWQGDSGLKRNGLFSLRMAQKTIRRMVAQKTGKTGSKPSATQDSVIVS
jgi:hypothetical protein